MPTTNLTNAKQLGIVPDHLHAEYNDSAQNWHSRVDNHARSPAACLREVASCCGVPRLIIIVIDLLIVEVVDRCDDGVCASLGAEAESCCKVLALTCQVQ